MKQWITKQGRRGGGGPITKNTLIRLLSNVTYCGMVKHRGTIYPGEHEAIVEDFIFKEAQELLRVTGGNGSRDSRSRYSGFLKGLLYCIPCNAGMIPTYTKKRSGRIYRYYVCVTAQNQGWAACPTKSVNAHDLETFVVAQLHSIMQDNELVDNIICQAREQLDCQKQEHTKEQAALKQRLRTLHSQIKDLVSRSGTDATDGLHIADRLADYHDQVRSIEHRLREIANEMKAIGSESIDPSDLKSALNQFTPIWDSLRLQEKHRIMHLLIEGIGYDGRDGTLTIDFRALGIKALSNKR
jgi:site-specific DNA recombinase